MFLTYFKKGPRNVQVFHTRLYYKHIEQENRWK